MRSGEGSSAGPDRLEAAGELGIPQVVSLGALDMVNFGPADTVPETFKGRHLYAHNPTVTLMRTTPEECAELGYRIATKLNAAKGPTALFVPLKGVSMIDVEGQVFHDPAANDALIAALREHISPSVEVHELNTDINDPEFAVAMANRLDELYRAWVAVDSEGRARAAPRADRRRQADHRCRRRHGALREMRRGGRRRPDHHLQLGSLPDGRPRLAGGHDALWRRQRDRRRHGGRGAARRRETPVLAGVCGTDPFRLMDVFLRQLREIGFSGVQNFPTVGLIDGQFRQNLEETGMGYGLEVDMIALARELDLLTCPYVFNEDEHGMAEAGADVLIPHMGLTTKGSIGAHTAKTLDECVERIQAMRDAAKAVNPDVIVLCHGGPIAEPEDASTCSTGRRGSSASSAHRAWNDCRPRSR